MSWVTIASFQTGVYAHILKGKLQSEGIEAVVADENIVRMNWLYSQAVGGVKVRVEEADVDKALEIIRAMEEPKQEDIKDESLPPCPQCKSKNVYYERRPFAVTILFFFVFMLPLPFFKKRWKCRRCQHEWRAKST